MGLAMRHNPRATKPGRFPTSKAQTKKPTNTMSLTAPSSFSVHSAPASPSMVSSEASTPRYPQQPNIWTLFRLPTGSEQTHVTQKVSTRRHKKVLHYCLACEKWGACPTWSSAYTGNAKEHVQRAHRAERREWSLNHITAHSTEGPNQTSIDHYIPPIGVHRSQQVVLRQAFDKPRFIRAFIALCAQGEYHSAPQTGRSLKNLFWRAIMLSRTFCSSPGGH